MRPCGDFDLRAYLDGEIAGGDRAAFEAHLAACERCRQDAADLARVLALLRAAPDIPPRPDFTARVMDAIEARSAVSARRRLPARRYALAASFLLVCALAAGVYLATRGGEPAAEVALQFEPAAPPPPAQTYAAPTAPALGFGLGGGRAEPAAEETAGSFAVEAEAALDAAVKDGAILTEKSAAGAPLTSESLSEPPPSALWVVLPETGETWSKLAELGVARAVSEARATDLNGEQAAALALLAGRGRWGVETEPAAARRDRKSVV